MGTEWGVIRASPEAAGFPQPRQWAACPIVVDTGVIVCGDALLSNIQKNNQTPGLGSAASFRITKAVP